MRQKFELKYRGPVRWGASGEVVLALDNVTVTTVGILGRLLVGLLEYKLPIGAK